MKLITSKANETFKKLKKYSQKSNGEDYILIEGERFVLDVLISSKMAKNSAHHNNSEFLQNTYAVFKEDLDFARITQSLKKELIKIYSQANVEQFIQNTIILPPHLFAELCMTKSPQSILLVCKKPQLLDLADLFAKPSLPERVLILENVSDPGNMGNILRLAAAFSSNTIILLGETVSPYNPKVLRSSMGNIFKLDIYQEKSVTKFLDYYQSKLAILKKQASQKVYLLGASLAGENLADFVGSEKGKNILKNTIFWAVGNEGNGLTPQFQQNADYLLKIEMAPDVESLNVATATGIFLYTLRK